MQTRIRSVENSGILGWWNKIAAEQVSMQYNKKNNSNMNFTYRHEKSRHLVEVMYALLKGFLIAFLCLLIEEVHFKAINMFSLV